MNLKFFAILLVVLASACTSSQQTTTLQTQTTQTMAGTATSLTDAFLGYRQSLQQRNLENFRKYTSAEAIAGLENQLGEPLTADNFNDIATLILSAAPPAPDVKVEGETITGNTAKWTVSDKSNPNNKGTVNFVKEGGAWKLFREIWEESG